MVTTRELSQNSDNPSLLARLAARVEAIIKHRNFKKTYFAHGKVSANTVINVLNGRNCRVSTLIDLAEALDCELVIDLQPRNQGKNPNPQHIAHDSSN